MADEATTTEEETTEEVAAPEEKAVEEEAPKEEPKAAATPKVEEAEVTVELSKDAQKILDLVEKLAVLDLANLVKALEQKFGVSAAAPMMMAGGGAVAAGGDAGAEDAGDGKKNVILASAGGQKIAVIKAVREITGLGLKEAKDIVDSAPKAVKEGVESSEAAELKKKLEEAGATVELQ